MCVQPELSGKLMMGCYVVSRVWEEKHGWMDNEEK